MTLLLLFLPELFFFLIFIYFAAPGLIFCTRSLWSSLRHAGSSSLMRDRTWPPALGAWSLSHWTTREIPPPGLLSLLKTFHQLCLLFASWSRHSKWLQLHLYLQLSTKTFCPLSRDQVSIRRWKEAALCGRTQENVLAFGCLLKNHMLKLFRGRNVSKKKNWLCMLETQGKDLMVNEAEYHLSQL